MSFENDKYSVGKDPYDWCLRQSKRLKAIDTKMNIQMKSQTPDTNARRTSEFSEMHIKMVELKGKPRERVSEVTKKRNSCHNCGSTDHYANNCPKAKKKVYAIEKVTEEKCPTEDSESESMGDAIREESD
ncbi:hypothetical protein O181_021338 [Austropuccinia psidii MF-1]|uniref:CCHC-type domain-containing protein n=1 Tax=Austropuccinia psidii MF-1 TaxID=1389203 RepID=A0A9Q3CD71_9BASI|nr:hypothetical protein [Austropuccinia psidii MF-1]